MFPENRRLASLNYTLLLVCWWQHNFKNSEVERFWNRRQEVIPYYSYVGGLWELSYVPTSLPGFLSCSQIDADVYCIVTFCSRMFSLCAQTCCQVFDIELSTLFPGSFFSLTIKIFLAFRVSRTEKMHWGRGCGSRLLFVENILNLVPTSFCILLC